MSIPRAALVIAMLVGGCGGWVEPLAQGTFSRERYCPPSSVTAHRREDLRPYDYAQPEHLPAPDADVAADPVRRAEWERRDAANRAAIDQRYSLVEIAGCGAHVLYLCHGGHLDTGCSLTGTFDATGAARPLF